MTENKSGKKESQPIPVPRRQIRDAEGFDSPPIEETSRDSNLTEEELDASCSNPAQETDQDGARGSNSPIEETNQGEEVGAPIQETYPAGAYSITEVPRNLSHLPQTVPHFVNREHECEAILKCLSPTEDCRCIFLCGAPGMGKTALAIKAANERLKTAVETGVRTVVVYVNCKYIDSFDDFGGKVLQQMYRYYDLTNPKAEMMMRLRSNDFYTILLLDNFEFLLNMDERGNLPADEMAHGRMNPAQSQEMKIKNFVAEILSCSAKVKLMVTSSKEVVFPRIGKKLIKLDPFTTAESFLLLANVCEDRHLTEECAAKLTDICSGIPLVLCTLMSSQRDLLGVVEHLVCSSPEENLEFLLKIEACPEGEKINVCLEFCFGRLSVNEQNTLIRLALLRGRFTPSGAAKVFHSTALSEHQIIAHVFELANCSLLEQNVTGDTCWYTFLSVIREFCKRKASERPFCEAFHGAFNLFIDHFLTFLKDTFKMFLSRNALRAITDFQREEENIMQLLEWFEKGQMDEERMARCIDVFNMVGELLAKMMGKTKFKFVYALLKKKCEDMRDQQRMSECLTSLGIKEVFNCSCSPGLCDEASKRAKAYLMEADRIQSDLRINTGNSRAQCLAKLGRCLAKECDSRDQGKSKIEEAIRIRLNDYDDEDICRVMLGATYNDKAVALSLEEAHGQAIRIREKETLPIYREKLGDHPFTATILNNLSNNFHALGEFDSAKQCSENALKIRRELLKDHRDTAKSLFDLGMVHKEKGDFQQAVCYLQQSKTMQEKVVDDNRKDLQRTEQELAHVQNRLANMEENMQLE